MKRIAIIGGKGRNWTTVSQVLESMIDKNCQVAIEKNSDLFPEINRMAIKIGFAILTFDDEQSLLDYATDNVIAFTDADEWDAPDRTLELKRKVGKDRLLVIVHCEV